MARREVEAAIPLSRFGVLVAQLSSIAASAPQQPPDALLCFDLLSELVAAIEEEPKESIQQWQRKCEDALYSLLILGARRPVRRLASTAMSGVITKGDSISIYSRASTLQGWLADGKKNEPFACAGVARCLGELYRIFGRRITSGFTETTNIAAKLMKFHEDFVRKDALQMLEDALEGCGGSGATAAYSDSFRIIIRLGVSDKSSIVRVSAARCLKTFASIGGPGLNITDLENSMSYCVKALDDPISSVRDAFAEALGGLLALAVNPEAQVKQRGNKQSMKLEDGIQKYLIMPFVRANGVRAKDLRVGLALSWVFFLQVVRLKYHLPDIELQMFASLLMDMLQGNASEDAHALACVLYIFRIGIADQMTEPTQRSFLVFLARKLESADYIPSVRVTILRILSYLLNTLGEVPTEFKDILDNTVVAALSHSSLHVRIEAALTLRALAEVDPTCVGGLISYGVTTLNALRESGTFEKGTHLQLELDSLHGQAALIAALVAISPKLPLGYPARLPQSVFDVSKKMLTEFSRNPLAASVEKEAGWLLLASLIASMPKEELESQVFDILLLWVSYFVRNRESYFTRIQDPMGELRVLSAAIEALTAFIKKLVYPSGTAYNGGVLLQPVLSYLSVALSYISILSKQLGHMKPALALFTMRTLMAYQSIPNPMAFKTEHSQIIQICSFPFSDPVGCEESSCLRTLLDKKDACLGPWITGRYWFEDEFRAFNGCKDGLMPCVWEDEVCSFPQTEAISKLLVNQMLLCFGTMFAMQDDGGKLMLLNKIQQCLRNGKKQSWRIASITNACVGLLSGLKAVLDLRAQKFTTEVLSTMQSIFLGILADHETVSAQRRACSEGLGYLARLGSDIVTARMTRSLLGELGTAIDSNHIASIAFSLGCIYRSAGGMALSTLVTLAVNSISLLAKSSTASLQLWSLHSLLLIIEAAGLSYVSQVQATLFLAMEILLSDENGLLDLRQEIARVVNAIVAVLGPELSPGSTFFSRCKSVIAEVSSCQETSALLESVRFTQQLVLFAPQAASVHSHVRNLLPTLSSRQPSLRHLAVSTVRHLIEKDPVSMIDINIEEYLFSMLDEETDSEVVSLLKATITQWLYTSCPSCPSRWLNIFHSMVLGTPTKRSHIENISGAPNNSSPLEVDGMTYFGDDDEDMISSNKGEQLQDSSSASAVEPKRNRHLRYRTRVFAAECLSNLPSAVGSNLAHFDLSLARSVISSRLSSSTDWLVLHLQELVSLSYQISTGQFEGMQHIGVKLLSIVIDKFGSTLDPEFSGHLLLELYQAQLVSAVRSAISDSSGPLLLEAGLELARKILTSRIVSGDRVALNRMYSLISRPLNEIKDLYYPSFAEWVACKIKIRLLAAHASVKDYVYQSLMDQKSVPDDYMQLVPLFSSSSRTLGNYWIKILKDYSYICFGLSSKFHYKPFLEGIQSLVVSFKVKKCLDESWPPILRAAALDAVPVKFEMEKSPNLSTKKLQETLLSGYSMVRLDPSEFQFLWGLSLLIMFQAEQLICDKELRLLFNFDENPKCGDSVLHGTPDVTALYRISLMVIESLSKQFFFSQEFLSAETCTELLEVLLYSNTAVSLSRLVVSILSQILQFCPDGFYEMESFTAAASEICLKYLILVFLSIPTMQDHSSCQDLLSELSIIAETISHRMIHVENCHKFIMALLSLSNKCFTVASTDLVLSKVAYFVQSITPSVRKCLRAANDANSASNTIQRAVFAAWASTLTALADNCMRRISNIKNKTSDSYKHVLKILIFSLDETVSVARLIHETLQLGQKEESSGMFLFSIFRSCTNCFSNILCNTSIQVQALGIHVIKSIVQGELGEGSQGKRSPFVLLFAVELLVDFFALIQQTLKGHISKESGTVIGECLSLLFLINSLSQGSEYHQAVTGLLLDALLLVFSLTREHDSQELSDVNITATRMVSRIVQIPSVASRIKDLMLAMPVKERQQLQDMIRASVNQGPVQMQVKSSMPERNVKDRQIQSSEFKQAPIQKHENSKEVSADHVNDDDDDDDGDWDSFQSLPANTASVSEVSPHEISETAANDNSSLADSNCNQNDDVNTHQHPVSSEAVNEADNLLHSQIQSSGFKQEHTHEHGNSITNSDDHVNGDDDADYGDWDSFQSLPANVALVSEVDPHELSETAASDHSSPADSNFNQNDDDVNTLPCPVSSEAVDETDNSLPSAVLQEVSFQDETDKHSGYEHSDYDVGESSSDGNFQSHSQRNNELNINTIEGDHVGSSVERIDELRMGNEELITEQNEVVNDEVMTAGVVGEGSSDKHVDDEPADSKDHEGADNHDTAHESMNKDNTSREDDESPSRENEDQYQDGTQVRSPGSDFLAASKDDQEDAESHHLNSEAAVDKDVSPLKEKVDSKHVDAVMNDQV